jgi:hypothetical protein
VSSSRMRPWRKLAALWWCPKNKQGVIVLQVCQTEKIIRSPIPNPKDAMGGDPN